MSTDADIRSALAEWAGAEESGDASALQSLLAAEFTAIGPVGFSLSRQLPSALRASIFLTRTADRWQLAFTQMSFVAGTAGAPPIAGGDDA